MFNKPSIISTVKKVMPAVVSVVIKEGSKEVGGGSGFIVDKSGIVLTNRHVVPESESNFYILLSDERKFSAEVIARDPLDDIAILKIISDGETFPTVELSKTDKLDLGQEVLSFGNVLGIFQNTVSHGIISGLSRSIRANIDKDSPALDMRGLIQTDAAINPGNSGGPLTNLKGEVVGINVAIISGAQNISFSIPIKIARRDLSELKNHGYIKRPFLGVRHLTIDKEMSKKLKQEFEFGALVLREHPLEDAVVKGSPADKADIKENDLILRWGGEKITTKRNIQDILSESEVGDEVELEIFREGETLTKKLQLAERK